MKIRALQSLARSIDEVALRAFDLEDLKTPESAKTKKSERSTKAKCTLAPLAASPAGTVTLGSGLTDIVTNADVIKVI